MEFTITGLPMQAISPLLQMPDAELRAAGVAVVEADAANAYPCRVTLEDAAPGEELLLFSYAHLAGNTPYAATGPIFVRRAATATAVFVNEVPEQQRSRLLSVRAYDSSHQMVDADVAPGTELTSLIARFLRTAGGSLPARAQRTPRLLRLSRRSPPLSNVAVAFQNRDATS